MAVEIVAPAAAKIVGDQVAKYASPYVSYFFCYGKIVEDFKHHREQLEFKKDRVKNDVDEAIRQTEVIEKDVQDWLTKAEKELREAQSLVAEIERSKCFSWCPSWGWRYCLSKKVAKKTLGISKLLETSDFPRVGHCVPLEGIELILSKDVMPFESSKSALNGIMNALKSDAVSMIGLHGMPGVGKTTLATEVAKQVKKGLFDKVVMVAVSKTPNINNIQTKIAEILGLKFEAETEEGRAEKLWRRLNDEKKMLIIFDDVWAEMELEPFGIIRKQMHMGCKFLLTTRLHQVCNKMDCQEIFRLDLLSEDEAWALFKDNAGLKDASPALTDVAKEVARECKGLPLAIVTIAKTLKGEDLERWRVANQRLKGSRKLDYLEDLYSHLEVSYDYLKEDEIQSCFLLCSLFPEDYNISIEMLTICGIGEGLFNDIDLIEERRREIRVAVTRLRESGLLLETDDEDSVRMHDVVRDCAHWITAKGKKAFMVKDGLKKWSISESFRHSTKVSLWNCELGNLPDRLEFTKLETLFLMGKKKSLVLPSTFFEGMKALRVLFLKYVELSLDALEFLTDLQTLCFECCELKNISSLRNKKSLEILALLETNIEELPEELVELHKLKSLYFSGNYLPDNLISRLTSLQELHLKRKGNGKTHLNIWELNSLSHLTAFRVSIDEYNFQGNFMFPKLQRYDITVNSYYHYWNMLDSYTESDCWRWGALRTLTIFDFSSSLSAFKELFCNMEILTLDNVIMEHKNIVPNVDREGLNKLTSLDLRKFEDLECLIDVTREEGPTTAFSTLVKLKMEKLTRLKELCHGQPPIGFLQKLEVMRIVDCHNLRYIFSSCIPQNLEVLWISRCSGLEQVFGFLEERDGNDITLPQLQDLVLQDLMSLRSFCSVKLPSLKRIQLRCCHQLTHFMIEPDIATIVEAELEENQELIPLSNSTCLELESLPQLSCIRKVVHRQSLTTMEIDSCDKLASLFSATLAQALVHLKQLKISHCESLEHLIIEAENEDDIVSNMSHRYPLCWPKLKTLVISKCKSLKYAFPITLAQGLPCLKSVHISDCPQLMQVFDMAKQKDGQDIVLPQLQVLTLENLENLNSFSPGNYSVMLPSLKEFKVCRLSLSSDRRCTFQSQYMQDVQLYGFKELLSNVKNLTLQGVIYLKNLIPIADPKGLNELTVLELIDGEELECLIDTTDQGNVLTNAFFNLVKLVILKMDSLKMFCNGQLPKGFLQKLEKLEIRRCKKVVSLSLPLQNLQEVKVIHCDQLQEVFQIYELLHDREKNQELLLSNLTRLKLKSLPKLKWIWKSPTHYVSLQSLKVAYISGCHSLKYLFSASVAQSLLLLEQLEIDCCDGLEHIIEELESGDAMESDGAHPHPPLLPKLTTLSVSHCPRLDYVLQIPLAQGLPLLKSVSITESPQLKQVIVAKEKNGVDRAIALPNLQDLQLKNLINLSCFCSENYLIELPSLEKLRVWDCPRLTNFIIQKEANEHVQLQELYLSDLGNDKGCDIINFQLRQSSRNLEYITVANCEKIFEIQAGNFLSRVVNVKLNLIHQLQGPIQAITLQYLRVLIVSNCNRLKSLFSPMLARNLLQLDILDIRHCEGLEEIIEVDRTSSSSSPSHLQPIFLPSLKVILIKGCNSLKSLFPVSVIPSLSKLKRFKIQMASKLEQVFGYQSELDVGDDQKVIVFPELIEFRLLELLCLERLAPMGYYFQFPRLNYVEVKGCPKMTTSFSMDSNNIVHAIIEAPQQVQRNTMEGFTTMEEVADDGPTCSDISWSRWNNTALPVYIKVEETEEEIDEDIEEETEDSE